MTKQTTDTRTEPKLDGDGNPIGPDIMPEPIDDQPQIETRADSGEQADSQPGEQRRERKPKRQERDRREEITKMWRELRDKQNAEEPTEPTSAKQESIDTSESPAPETAPESTDSQRQGTANSGQSEQKTQPQLDEIILKIDGKEVRKPFNEVVALAQIGAASENRLDEAKRLLSEVKALHAQATQSANPPAQPEKSQSQTAQAPSQNEPQSAKPAANPPTGLDAEDRGKLRDIADRLLYGDPDAAPDAIQEVIDAAVAKAPRVDPAEIARIVRETFVQHYFQAEADAALAKFSERYKPLIEDPILAETSATVLRREIMKDLKAAGFRDEELAAAASDINTLAYWHRAARQTHRNLRNYDQLLTDVGEYMVKKVKLDQPNGTPSPANQQHRDPNQAAQERLERKRALPTQPRPANVRAQIETGPRPKTREEILNEIRRARGFAPIR